MATHSKNDTAEQIASLEATFRALQDQAIRTNQLINTAAGQLAELKGVRKQRRKKITDWSFIKTM